MPNFTMLVGLSGSGKSYYASDFFMFQDTAVISSDSLRKELYGNESDQTHNSQVFTEMEKRTIENLKNNKSVLYDATNLNRKRRVALLKNLKKEVKRNDISYFCSIIYRDIEECIRLDSERERTVGENVIISQARMFEIPTKDEGWDYIGITDYVKEKITPMKYIESLKDFDQKNHNHALTLGEHCIKTREHSYSLIENLNSTNWEYPIIMASYLHDIGKVYTGAINKYGDMSYFNHENVGAYMVLGFSNYFSKKDIMVISWLIQYHMRPYTWSPDNKGKSNFVKIWTDTLTDKLLVLHEADKLAH